MMLKRSLSSTVVLFSLVVVLLASSTNGFRHGRSLQPVLTPSLNVERSLSSSKSNTSWPARKLPPQSTAQTTCLNLRGGSVSGILTVLVKTAIQNPVLVLLMLSSTLVSVYKEQVPYPKQIQSFFQMCIVGYVFYMLVQWQKMQQDAAEES
ncbi:patatin-like phospholipase domain containing 8 [Seminavis robusta]|uniref:Patatin-like phospholipase domain containing 8 n=1 Tax=Seminavis robusta TaxID=568900 RepID=A0A9N8HRF9_9STRA|nr:patatin-like phospholipase domain containing 8 [Seminavis robusta]|eukprot:Sro1267_g257700.1 patatin-like phospholipase domain containing 8 (151) ;mRNA; f:26066-26600